MPLDIEKINRLIGDRSRQEIADAAGMKRENIARILAGKKKQIWLSTIERLASALGVSAHDILI